MVPLRCPVNGRCQDTFRGNALESYAVAEEYRKRSRSPSRNGNLMARKQKRKEAAPATTLPPQGEPLLLRPVIYLTDETLQVLLKSHRG